MRMVWTETFVVQLRYKTRHLQRPELKFIISLFIDRFSFRLPVRDIVIIHVTPLQINSPGGKVPLLLL